MPLEGAVAVVGNAGWEDVNFVALLGLSYGHLVVILWSSWLIHTHILFRHV